MNTYLIPVTESYGYNYDYIALVHANTSQEAYLVAKQIPDIINYDHTVCQDKTMYETYNNELYIPKNFFYVLEKDDIMAISFKNTKGYVKSNYYYHYA